MKTTIEQLREHLLHRAGVYDYQEYRPPTERKKIIESYKKSEWCPEFKERVLSDLKLLRDDYPTDTFFQLMRDNLFLGAFRYGKLGSKGKPQYDRMSNAHKRLEIYFKTKNLNLLVDVANMYLCEYVEGDYNKEVLVALTVACIMEYTKNKNNPDYYFDCDGEHDYHAEAVK